MTLNQTRFVLRLYWQTINEGCHCNLPSSFVLQAANQGAKFKGRVLQISWFKPKTPSVTTEPEEVEAKDEDSAVRHITLERLAWLHVLS